MDKPIQFKPVPGTVEGYKDFCRRHQVELTPTVLAWLPDAIKRGNEAVERHQRDRINKALAKAGS